MLRRQELIIGMGLNLTYLSVLFYDNLHIVEHIYQVPPPSFLKSLLLPCVLTHQPYPLNGGNLYTQGQTLHILYKGVLPYSSHKTLLF